MKNILLVAVLFLAACGGGDHKAQKPTEQIEIAITPEPEPEPENLIVAGQSNAVLCDWSSFEYEVENIAISGRTINYLVNDFDMSLRGDFDGIIFVHGETDSIISTPIDKYIIMVEAYRNLISTSVGKELKLYISSVGYYREDYDAQFDNLRIAVELEAMVNENWEIFFHDARTFRAENMLVDEIHFDQQGCETMFDAFTSYIKQT